MKHSILGLLIVAMLATVGCDKASKSDKSPAFMFWCFRPENVSAEFVVPKMATTEDATLLHNRFKAIPGFVESRFDLDNKTVTVKYQSSVIRSMNFEEAISLAGYSANSRPAHATASNR